MATRRIVRYQEEGSCNGVSVGCVKCRGVCGGLGEQCGWQRQRERSPVSREGPVQRLRQRQGVSGCGRLGGRRAQADGRVAGGGGTVGRFVAAVGAVVRQLRRQLLLLHPTTHHTMCQQQFYQYQIHQDTQLKYIFIHQVIIVNKFRIHHPIPHHDALYHRPKNHLIPVSVNL